MVATHIALSEPKLDGLSLSLRCIKLNDNATNNYMLEWASTRENGYYGEDVTHAMQDCCTIPKTIAIPNANDANSIVITPNVIEIRGEIMLPIKSFKRCYTTSTNNT